MILLVASIAGVYSAKASARPHEYRLEGTVESNGSGLPGYTVSLYASYAGRFPIRRKLGTTTSDANGYFKMRYGAPVGLLHRVQPVLFVLAEDNRSGYARERDRHGSRGGR